MYDMRTHVERACGHGQGWGWGWGWGWGYYIEACGHELHDDAQIRLLDHRPDKVDHVAVAHLVRDRGRV